MLEDGLKLYLEALWVKACAPCGQTGAEGEQGSHEPDR